MRFNYGWMDFDAPKHKDLITGAQRLGADLKYHKKYTHGVSVHPPIIWVFLVVDDDLEIGYSE